MFVCDCARHIAVGQVSFLWHGHMYIGMCETCAHHRHVHKHVVDLHACADGPISGLHTCARCILLRARAQVLKVEFPLSEDMKEVEAKTFKISQEIMRGTSDQLFGFIATCIQEVCPEAVGSAQTMSMVWGLINMV